jgi:hypothetical protein
MPTTPKIADDEAPFDAATLDAFLRSMSAEMVLVGGQALAFWMNRYGIRSDGAMISNDGDALGTVRHARFLAGQLRATLVLPDAAALTSLVAQLRLPVEGGKVRNVDILHLLYSTSGLRKSGEFTRRVRRNAVTVRIEPEFELRIMHPLDVLESRVHNAVGLIAEKGEHVVTQARWAIAVAKVALLRLARDPAGDDQRVGIQVQRILRLWKSSVGQRLWKEHGLCILDAVDEHALREARPPLQAQLANIAQSRPSAGAT